MKQLSNEESDYKIVEGDCLEVMRGFADNQFDLVLTDPPYGLEDYRPVGNRGEADREVAWDKLPSKEIMNEIRRISKNQIIWGANYLNCFERGGAIVWDKMQPLPDSSQAEIASVSGYRKVFLYKERWTNFVNTKVSEHPTEKSVGLMKFCLEIFPNAKTILDPFAGSGTTLRAAKDLNRKCTVIEISPKYIEIIKKRERQEVLL